MKSYVDKDGRFTMQYRDYEEGYQLLMDELAKEQQFSKKWMEKVEQITEKNQKLIKERKADINKSFWQGVQAAILFIALLKIVFDLVSK